MTLILGIKCRDGIVAGADGAATFATMEQMTIRQPVKKLNIIDGQMIVGISGPVGLGQRLAWKGEKLWRAGQITQKSPTEAMVAFRVAFWAQIAMELQVAGVANQTIGSIARRSALTTTVIALPLGLTCRLFQFDQQGAPEEVTDDAPFVSIGSGQPLADPFLAFLRRVFWPSSLPSLADGVFAAYWALDHAIKTSPGGVAEPKQIVVMEQRSGGGWAARELSEEELQEPSEAVQAAEQALADFRLSGKAEMPPKPPPSP